MLVDDHQPVLGLGDDIGRGDLPPGNAEGERRDRRVSGFGAGGGSKVSDQFRHPSESWGLLEWLCHKRREIPAFAGMTGYRLDLPGHRLGELFSSRAAMAGLV